MRVFWDLRAYGSRVLRSASLVPALLTVLAATGLGQVVPTPTPADSRSFVSHVLTNTAVFEAIMIYVFGLIVVVLEYVLLRKAQAKPEEVLRTFTITLIIILSLTVLTNGSERAEFTPIIGLFGTIIGYLLGSKGERSRKPAEKVSQDSGKDQSIE